MNKNMQKQRVNIELNQIRTFLTLFSKGSILNDFRKTKYKCIELAKIINIEMPKQEHFKNVQKNTLRKMDLLDITGLVNLKNQLVRALTDLFEIERQLRYKKQKSDAKKQMMDDQVQQLFYLRKNQAQSVIQSPRQKNSNLSIQKNFRSIITQPKKEQALIQEQKAKDRNLQIPLYRAKNQTNQNKLDRISKYIASLKRNMKLNSQTLGYKWKIKQFLMQDPNYVRLRTELQRFMMRQQELDNILANAVEKGVRQFIKQSQIVESNPEYKLIKIYKQKPKLEKQNVMSRIQSESHLYRINKEADEIKNKFIQSPKIKDFSNELESNPLDLSYRSPRFNKQQSTTQFNSITFVSPLKKLPSKIQIESKAQEDFNSIKKQLQKSNETYNQMISKINQTVQKGSQKLIQLREKRKKKLQKDQDIWGELQKL